MNISIHDNRLLSYCVSSDTGEIILHTIYEDTEPHEVTDVIFSGVVAYHFAQDNFSTIIFDVQETDAAAIYTSNREQFAIGQKYGWPGMWNGSEAEALAYFLAHNVKGFVLSSSYGMYGWVLAQEINKIKIDR